MNSNYDNANANTDDGSFSVELNVAKGDLTAYWIDGMELQLVFH